MLEQGDGGFKISYSEMGKEVSDHPRTAGFQMSCSNSAVAGLSTLNLRLCCCDFDPPSCGPMQHVFSHNPCMNKM